MTSLVIATVSLEYKDYRIGAPERFMTPDTNEFILRLLIHVLPKLAHAAVAASVKPSGIVCELSHLRGS